MPLIENNEHGTDEGKAFIRQDIERLLRKSPNIDTILLGCTHYPLIKEEIEKIVPASIKVIAQGQIVAESLQSYLDRHPEIETKCSREGKLSFFTSENTLLFDNNATRFTSFDIKSIHIDLSKR